VRVVHVTSWNERCGIATYAARLTRELAAIGLEQAVVARTPRSEPVALSDVHVRAVFDAKRPAEAAARVLASTGDADVVHLQFNFGVVPPRMLLAVVPALVRRGARVVVTLHAVTAPADPLFFARSLPALRGATLVLLGVARWPLESIARRFVDIARLPHGVPTFAEVDVMTARARLGVAFDPVVSTSGFALAHKRFDRLVSALPALARRFPNVGLVGACTRYPSPSSDRVIEELDALARRLGVADRVALSHDFLDDDALALRLFAGDVIALPYGRTRELASGAAAVALATGRRLAVSDARCFDAVRAFTEPLGDDVAGDLARLLAVRETETQAAARRAALDAEHGYAAVARRLVELYRARRSP
jgi:glycosyltransferase involved in cell wall biosynthesis